MLDHQDHFRPVHPLGDILWRERILLAGMDEVTTRVGNIVHAGNENGVSGLPWKSSISRRRMIFAGEGVLSISNGGGGSAEQSGRTIAKIIKPSSI